MKRMIIAIVTLLAAVTLSGCGASMNLGTALPQEQTRIIQENVMMSACHQWVAQQREKERAADLARFNGLDANGKLLVAMQMSNNSMLREVLGKNQDDCRPGTNIWDAYIAEVRAKNETARKGLGVFGHMVDVAAPVVGTVMINHDTGKSAGNHLSGGSQQGSNTTTTKTTTTTDNHSGG